MERDVEAQRESADVERGRWLTQQMHEELGNISRKTGERERESPLFGGSDASGQGGLLFQSQIKNIRSVVQAAKEEGHAPQKAVIAPVRLWIAEAAKSNGLDIDGYSHVLDGSAIRHTLNRHGNVSAEHSRGGLPITDADFEKIPEVIDSRDRIVLGLKTKGGRDAIGYLKRMSDGSTLHVEEVRTEKNLLQCQCESIPPRGI